MKTEYGLARRARRDLPPHRIAAAADAAESACAAAIPAGSRKAGVLMKGSRHTESHARLFGLSMAAVLAASLVLNAVSPSTRACQQSAHDFGTASTASVSASRRVVPAPEGGSVDPSGTIRSEECATNQGGEEPGYR